MYQQQYSYQFQGQNGSGPLSVIPEDKQLIDRNEFTNYSRFQMINNEMQEPLMDTPHELICPITQQLFKDPVVTSEGQVYEREAISQHLQNNHFDPVSRQKLSDFTLTPLFMIKSKVYEYRLKTSQSCIQKATSSLNFNYGDLKLNNFISPVKYVRRAVELLQDVEDIKVPGLNKRSKQYINLHQSNLYDKKVMEVFASSLLHEGYREMAQSVYMYLLRTGEDKKVQIDMLQRVISCWIGENKKLTEEHITNLVNLINQVQNISISQFLDLLKDTQLPYAFIFEVCEKLLQFEGYKTTSIVQNLQQGVQDHNRNSNNNQFGSDKDNQSNNNNTNNNNISNNPQYSRQLDQRNCTFNREVEVFIKYMQLLRLKLEGSQDDLRNQIVQQSVEYTQKLQDLRHEIQNSQQSFRLVVQQQEGPCTSIMLAPDNMDRSPVKKSKKTIQSQFVSQNGVRNVFVVVGCALIGFVESQNPFVKVAKVGCMYALVKYKS